MNSPNRLRDLKGLGVTTEKQLMLVGIESVEKLRKVGAVSAFIKLRKHPELKPSLNFLYALVGAIEDRHWIDIAKSERESLLMALDGYDELDALFLKEGISITD